MVAPFVKTEDVVMISPINTYHQETKDVAEIWRIQIKQRRAETVRVTSRIRVQLRHFDFQNKQRDGNGEYAVAKGFDTLRR